MSSNGTGTGELDALLALENDRDRAYRKALAKKEGADAAIEKANAHLFSVKNQRDKAARGRTPPGSRVSEQVKQANEKQYQQPTDLERSQTAAT